MCVFVSLCVCVWVWWGDAGCLGANLNLTASPSAFAALGNKFRQSGAACGLLHAHRVQPLSLCCCSESSLWLRVKVSEHSHQLLRMCGSDDVASSRRGKAQFQAVAVALYCRLVCVCVWVLCVCIVCAYCMWSRYTGRASGNQEGVSCSRRLESRFQHKREILFL